MGYGNADAPPPEWCYRVIVLDSTQYALVLLSYSCQSKFCDTLHIRLVKTVGLVKGKVMIGVATFLLCLTIFLLGGTLLCSALGTPGNRQRVEEIRRLRQEGLAVNQEGEG
jgi:hypothetical protein